MSGLAIHDISQVFDIGANKGQFASGLLKGGFSGEIISVEPLKEAHEILSAKATAHGQWTAAPRCVVGDTNGQTTINVSQNSVSSSVLAASDALTTAEPSVGYVSQETVDMKTLDAIAAPYLKEKTPFFVKIDTQGFEGQVIAGGERDSVARNGGLMRDVDHASL